ncbi:MAG: hypothetical protein OXI12_01725 [Gammaproteobacteria bacterium]|nr:hypothetical protein [Gammaproteobacteria bacterium]
MPETAVERYQPPPRPSMNELAVVEHICRQFAESSLCPTAYRGNHANVFFAAMEGRKFGWDEITSLNRIYVTNNRPTLTAEAMLGIIRQRGHKVSITATDKQAVVVGTRADTGETHTVTWTMEMAQRAKLTAKTRKGNETPWHHYPHMMLTWRAVTELGRVLFSDVLLGMHYTPEELGATVAVSDDGQMVVTDAEVVQVGDIDPLKVLRKSVKDDLMAKAGGNIENATAAWRHAVGDKPDKALEAGDIMAARASGLAWLEANTEPFGPVDEPADTADGVNHDGDIEDAEIVPENAAAEPQGDGDDGVVDGHDAYAEVLAAAGGDYSIVTDVWGGRGDKPVPVPALDEMRHHAKTLAEEAAANEVEQGTLT